MATAKDTRLFSIGMDKDSDERFMEQGRYREGRNIRLKSMVGDETYDPEMGKIHSADGHAATSLVSVTDTGDRCHGAFKDEELGLVYMFFAGSVAANNKIISFNETTGTPTLLIESSFLAFNIRYPILDVFKFDNLLVFNDALNNPRKIDVTGSYSGLDTWEFDQVTHIIQKPPLYAPSLALTSDTAFKGNNIVGKFFQFKYRYVYANNERSVFSPISEPAYSDYDLLAPDEVDTTTGTYNLVSILMMVDNANTIDAGSNRYPQKIELAVRQGNNGDFFLVDTIDCSAVSSVVYSFYNDGVYTPISLNESNQLMDDVPLVAGSMGLANNRLLFGDVTRGFNDSVAFDAIPSIILRDQPSATTYTGTSANRTVLSNFATFESTLAAAPWSYTYKAGDVFTVTGNATSPEIGFGIVKITSLIGESFESVYDRIMAASAGYPDIGIYDSWDSPKGTYYNETFTITIVSGSDTQLGFKSGEWYKAGLIYEDEWGRQQGVYTDPMMKFYVPTIPEREGITGGAVTNAGLCAFGLQINHQAPLWATRYKLAITPERVKAFSIMLTASEVTEPSTNLFEFELTTLVDYATDYDITNFTYSYSPGDRVRLLRKGVVGNWYTDVYDAEIIKYEEKLGVDGATTVPHIQANFLSASVAVGDLEGALIEIYTPTVSIDADDGIWYEIPGNSYPVVTGDHYGIINQHSSIPTAHVNKTPDALIEEGTYGRVRVLYGNSGFDPLPAVGSGTLIISGLGTTDADWNATYDVTGYDIKESYIDILVTTATMPVGDATTSLANCVDYDSQDAPAILTVSAFNAYGRTRNMTDEWTGAAYAVSDHYVESRYMNDFANNNDVMFIGRPSLVLSSKGEKRDKATIVYTEPYIYNTEINGLGRVFPDVNYEEYNTKFGAITKLFTRNDGVLMLQEHKVSKLLVGRDMIYNADGGGQMTTSTALLSKQIPFHGEFGCSRPESFASFGQYQFFVDTINGTPILVYGDKIESIADKMSKWFKGALKTVEDYNAVSARRMLVYGEYDGLYDEYVVVIKDQTGVRDTDVLVFSMDSGAWISFMDYDPDFIFRSFDRMIIADGETIYRPTTGYPGLIAGTYQDSIIEVVSNAEHLETKNYMALDIDATRAPTTVAIETQDGQASSLVLTDFVEREGHWQSYILRDSNTPDISTPLLYGDVIKSKTAKFTLTFDTTLVLGGVKLSSVSILVSKA